VPEQRNYFNLPSDLKFEKFTNAYEKLVVDIFAGQRYS